MAYVESEYVTIYIAQCDDCGWVDDEDYTDRADAERAAVEHEESLCPELLEHADPRTEREKYQDTLDALAGAVLRNK